MAVTVLKVSNKNNINNISLKIVYIDGKSGKDTAGL